MSSWPTSHVTLLHVVFPFETTQYIVSLSQPMKREKFHFYIRLFATNPFPSRQFGFFGVAIFFAFFSVKSLETLSLASADNGFCRTTSLAVYWRRTIF
ncbi:hypothetical protein EFP05_06930 [Lactiplantibacillus pentosus]|nr:hypothetical protein [Lactiplantibacillus pentosus]MCT3276901.1 hypothetical protein [Lactiplantibacillus pentosus]